MSRNFGVKVPAVDHNMTPPAPYEGAVRMIRGHRIERHESGEYPLMVYSDTKQPVHENLDRPCGKCGKPNTPEGHDACLGTLPGVMNACCGHGDKSAGYVQFIDGRCFRLGEEY